MKVIREFLRASRRWEVFDPRGNTYLVFGVLWGLGIDLIVFGYPGAEQDLWRRITGGGELGAVGQLALLAPAPALFGWVFGVLGVMRSERERLAQRSIALLEAEVQARTAHLKRMYAETVLALSATIEAKNPYTHGHSQRVWHLARACGVALELSEENLEVLRFGCYLHDIGKIQLPDAILDKPERLSYEDFVQVRTHAARGEQILAPIEGSVRGEGGSDHAASVFGVPPTLSVCVSQCRPRRLAIMNSSQRPALSAQRR